METANNVKSDFVPTELNYLRTPFDKVFATGGKKFKAYHGVIRIHAWNGFREEWDEINVQ